MARSKKWTIPFTSLNGTACRVDIFEEGYSGSVTELSTNNANSPGYPAAVPFEIEENDSNDLTDFIRFKTGSLRLVEVSYESLAGLMPRTITDHYIEAYYGSTLVFTGFMQCQEFDNDWVAAPRELEFPIISPLGLLEAFKFDAPQSPGLVTMGELMHEVITGLKAVYADVVYPMTSSYEPWDRVISSTVLVPFNDNFKHYDTASELYAPKDYKYFIEGICACYGWMVHDTPTSIVFTKYEMTGNYSRMTLAGLLNPASGWSGVQQSAPSFSNYYRNVDGNAMQSVIMPLKQVELSLEGVEIKDKKLETVHAITQGRLMDGDSGFRGIRLTQIGPDVDGEHIGTAVFTTGGDLQNSGLFPIGYGKIDQDAVSVGIQESWVIKYSTSWGTSNPILKATFYGQAPKDANGNCLIKLKMERGSSLQDMATTGYDDFVLNLVIKMGSQYYNMTNDTWASSLTLNSITIDGDTGKVVPNKTFASGPSIGPVTNIGDCDGIMFYMPYNGINDPIEVSIYKNSTTDLEDGEYLRITDLSLNNPGAIDEPYDSFYEDRDHIVVGNNETGTESRQVTVNFNNYFHSRGENTFGDRNYGPTGTNPTFPYLFVPMTVLTEKVKLKDGVSITFNEYAALWTYWINGWRWRMIAKNFNMRDDEYQITLARSSTIE